MIRAFAYLGWKRTRTKRVRGVDNEKHCSHAHSLIYRGREIGMARFGDVLIEFECQGILCSKGLGSAHCRYNFFGDGAPIRNVIEGSSGMVTDQRERGCSGKKDKRGPLAHKFHHERAGT